MLRRRKSITPIILNNTESGIGLFSSNKLVIPLTDTNHLKLIVKIAGKSTSDQYIIIIPDNLGYNYCQEFIKSAPSHLYDELPAGVMTTCGNYPSAITVMIVDIEKRKALQTWTIYTLRCRCIPPDVIHIIMNILWPSY
jgi:hypothetical protein